MIYVHWYDANSERMVRTSGEHEAIYVDYSASRVLYQVCLSIAEAKPIISKSNSEFSGDNTNTHASRSISVHTSLLEKVESNSKTEEYIRQPTTKELISFLMCSPKYEYRCWHKKTNYLQLCKNINQEK